MEIGWDRGIDEVTRRWLVRFPGDLVDRVLLKSLPE